MQMNKKVVLRLTRNVIIAILSVGWIAPTIAFLIVFLHWQISLKEEFPSHLSHIEEIGNDFFFMSSMSFLVVAAIWLAVVIIFWTLVAANKLWPIKPKEDKKRGLKE